MKNKSISMILRVFLLMLTAAFLLPALSACTGTPTPNGYAPVNSQNYSNNNEINDFTLYIPVDWTLDESKGMLAAYAADGRDGHVSVIAEKTDEETPDAAAYWEQYRTEFEQTFRDFTLLQGILIVSSTATIVALLIADLVYSVLDPRVRTED